MLEDGSYEAMCVDVDGTVLSITILTGAHKGEVVDVRADALTGDTTDLLAMPCALTVKDGQPHVVFD